MDGIGRRKFLSRGLLASGAAIGLQSFEERHLVARAEAAPGAPAASGSQIPKGKIAGMDVSRVICGGNLIGGWAHSRDLIYVSPLVKAYHTDEKVFETLRMAEGRGINMLLGNPSADRVINDYWKKAGGKIQWISDCALRGDVIAGVNRSLEGGAAMLYVQGGLADIMVRDGKIDEIAKALDVIRAAKKPAGIGAHSLETIKECVAAGLEPDFWMKTLHQDTYWSATPQENRGEFDEISGSKAEHGKHHDNMWCTDAPGTIEFMKGLKAPWIAFKTLAAGAIHPKRAFKWAFESGADFICVGMFDFQLQENCDIAHEAFAAVHKAGRPREWMG